ncbi:hypothetical protein IWQ57_000211 [Coemansia nantahalensis]|uniref:Uncharacterized protein n=1 Tax=Coemansia nantahalensis TaxID=2789366 RepID=A0ACC1K8S0_9FUNG|nr:hypothetical protein IWQ57_000211 [Coemansia nantahalensis]
MSKEHTAVSGALDASGLEFTPVDGIAGTVSEMQASFAGGVLRSMESRKEQLRAMLRGLREEKPALLDALHSDLRKHRGDGEYSEFCPVEYEIGLTLDNMDAWARADSVSLGLQQPVFLLSKAEVRREPLGVVLVMGAWNFPMRLSLMPVVGAIAAGNCVVLKPSDLAPHTAAAMERALTKYMDPAVIRVVQGDAAQGTELLRQRFDHFFYTGGGAVGRLVAHAAAECHAGVTLELGGKSPAIVHADVADLGPVATRIMWSKLSNAGQVCVGADHLIVHRSVKDRLLKLLVEVTHSAYGRSPQTSNAYGRIVNARHWRRLMDALGETRGTPVDVTDDAPDEDDRYIPPTIVDNVQADDALMREELFGPILPVLTYDTLDEAIAMVNARAPPLTLYVFAGSAAAEHVISHTRSGSAVVNDTMINLASHATPFGGVGPSGVGNYTGRYSFETFSHARYVLKRPLWFPTPAVDSIRMPPFDGPDHSWKLPLVRAMAFPRARALRDSLLGRLATYVPFWRVLAIVPGFVVALIKAQPLVGRKRRREQ